MIPPPAYVFKSAEFLSIFPLSSYGFISAELLLLVITVSARSVSHPTGSLEQNLQYRQFFYGFISVEFMVSGV